jgi:hypothetical protein
MIREWHLIVALAFVLICGALMLCNRAEEKCQQSAPAPFCPIPEKTN